MNLDEPIYDFMEDQRHARKIFQEQSDWTQMMTKLILGPGFNGNLESIDPDYLRN